VAYIDPDVSKAEGYPYSPFIPQRPLFTGIILHPSSITPMKILGTKKNCNAS